MNKVFKIQDSRDTSDTTLVHFILDETGSMSSVRDATIDGFNEYINGLKKDKENKYRMSLTKFDSTGIEVVYKDKAVSRVPDLSRKTYSPGAMTNLNDAIGQTIKTMEKIVSRKQKRHNVLLVIMTDGHENASVEFSADQIKSLIQSREKDGWTITFLGANMDAQKVSRTYAIKSGNAKSYSTANMAQTMRGLSSATQVYASSATVGAASDSFFSGTDDWTETDSASSKVESSISSSLGGVDISQVNNHGIGGVATSAIEQLFEDIAKEEDDSDE